MRCAAPRGSRSSTAWLWNTRRRGRCRLCPPPHYRVRRTAPAASRMRSAATSARRDPQPVPARHLSRPPGTAPTVVVARNRRRPRRFRTVDLEVGAAASSPVNATRACIRGGGPEAVMRAVAERQDVAGRRVTSSSPASAPYWRSSRAGRAVQQQDLRPAGIVRPCNCDVTGGGAPPPALGGEPGAVRRRRHRSGPVARPAAGVGRAAGAAVAPSRPACPWWCRCRR